MLIKENQSKSICDRERAIETRQKIAEKRVMEYEKKKKGDEKLRYQDIMEANREAEHKRKRVRDGEDIKDKQAFNMYKESVMSKHKRIPEERKNWLNTVKLNAREEMRRLSLTKARREADAMSNARNEERNTFATLEVVENKVKAGFDNAQEAKLKTREKMMSLSEKEAFQAMKHRENMERKELEKAANMLELLDKKKKAVEKFERMKR